MDFEKDQFEEDDELSRLEDDDELGGDGEGITEEEEEILVVEEEPTEEGEEEPAEKPAPKAAPKKAAPKKAAKKPAKKAGEEGQKAGQAKPKQGQAQESSQEEAPLDLLSVDRHWRKGAPRFPRGAFCICAAGERQSGKRVTRAGRNRAGRHSQNGLPQNHNGKKPGQKADGPCRYEQVPLG